jgi:alpha-tubulin suppressor-like RCC1 family protein
LAPVRLPFKNVSRAFTGGFHSLVLTQEGALYTMGFNQFGNLEVGHTTPCKAPQLVFPSGVQNAAAGWDHVMVLLKDGSVWQWGTFSGLSPGKILPTQIEFSPQAQISFMKFFHSDVLEWK